MVNTQTIDEPILLNKQWEFFLDNGSWAENPDEYLTVMKRLCTVSSIQNFWTYVNWMKQTMMKVCTPEATDKFSLRMFRSGVRPIWEDQNNRYGGKWIIPFRDENMDSHDMWVRWQEVLMCLVGGTFCRDNAICGCVLAAKANGRKEIQIWVDSCPADLESEKRFLMRLCSVDDLWFRKHEINLARVDTRSRANSINSIPEENPQITAGSSFRPTQHKTQYKAPTPILSLAPQTVRILTNIIPCE